MAPRSDSPHYQSFNGRIRDFNGTGIWSVAEVQARYHRYCERFQVSNLHAPMPKEHREGETVWIYPIMDEVILGIENCDPACIALGVDFVEENDLFPFGKTLKSNTARALRRAVLNEEQKERLRERIVTMLTAGIIPHEMREYVKLLRAIGVGKHWTRLERDIPRENAFAMRFYNALLPSKPAAPRL